MIATAKTAHAGVVYSDTFDTDPVLSSTQAAGTYYTDRYAPSGFTSESFMGDNRLALTLSSSDGANNRPAGFSGAFYNTQGRKYDVFGATTISIDMYIDQAFESDPNRVAGLWGTAVDSGNNNIVQYPIVEFAGGAFQIWDGGSFQSLGLPTGFSYGSFANLAFTIDPTTNQTHFSVNGSLTQTIAASGSVAFREVIIQGYNTADGIDRTIYFDNLVASNTQDVPAPATLSLMALSLVLMGWTRRTRLARR
ncbi:PEP-CTERM sorting domain-containing protein [Kineobactrum salinum]|uniref:PEP-CTERM sorting domain-containing protein n=1 Tax=Kineobactrum salinum TaxID=2708301 RepID=A0A6C0TY10_9GAMM|nr:PEP-CTERM sorting domain-containing protein [Kineobactrum salinum]QIB64656.1 PEP-CTERM sorting domain-containing protein [Kineobactrum salinum]